MEHGITTQMKEEENILNYFLEKMYDFSFILKLLSEGAFLISSGNSFHFILAEYEMERLPYSLVLELGTNKLFLLLVS
jgi:hypothetical protein